MGGESGVEGGVRSYPESGEQSQKFLALPMTVLADDSLGPRNVSWWGMIPAASSLRAPLIGGEVIAGDEVSAMEERERPEWR
jgi:hypothetical protein